MRHALSHSPELKLKLRRAVLDRASLLCEVKGLNPLVEESLAILAAGRSLSPDRLPLGIKARSDLYAHMEENRMKRLVIVGFSEDEAEELSRLHTPNFM